MTAKSVFARDRQPGDIVFAWIFLAFSLFLLSQLGSETTWKEGGRLAAQAPFWPTIAVWSMVVFSAFHLVGSMLSPRVPGRWKEVGLWVRSFEYAMWFMVYVFSVPVLGYLAATVVATVLLAMRVGYRTPRWLLLAALSAFVVVLIFKTFLAVKVPGGAVYEYLPQALRAFMIQYF